MDTIASLLSSVALPAMRQFTFILMYDSYISDVEAQIPKLQREAKEVRHTVEAAKRSGEEIEDTVKDWFLRVHAAIEEARAFLNKEDRRSVGCMDLYTRYTLSQEALNQVQVLCSLREERFDRVSYRCALSCNISSTARGYEALESRTSVMNEIMEALKDANVYMVGVYGMGGVGKTSLVKELAWKAEKDGSFDMVVVATVTHDPDVQAIRAEIADGLGLAFDEQTEMGRASRLRQRIRQEHKILVVLDDIWGKIDLTEVGVPFGEDHGGCKLLLTSRDHNVLNSHMGAQKVFRLEVLSEDESWSLFEKRADDAVHDASIQPIAKQVGKSCAGLPLLIVTMEEELKNKDLYAWKDALEQLKKFDGSVYSQVHSSIEMSYNYLESNELKTFFLLLGSMGNGYSTKDLLVFGWCLRLYKYVNTLADGRNRLYKMIDDLRASCLLLEGERDSVVLLDIVRIVAASIALRVDPFFALNRNAELKEWPRMEFLKTCHHIFLDWCFIHELPERLECPKLKILRLNNQGNYLKVPDNFFAETRELKVLSLGGLHCSPSLPSSLGLLKSLQALTLCKCMLEDIAIVGELSRLEILSLERSEVKELPARLGQLIHLRLLDLTDCSSLGVIPRNLLSSLTRLEELYMGNCNIQWKVGGGENQSNNSSLDELKHLHRLTTLDMQVRDASVFPRDMLAFWKLERYNILIGDGWKFSGVESGSNKISRTLKLNLNMDPNPGILLDYGIKCLLARAEDLYLDELRGVREVLYELSDEGFSQLKHLNIQNSAEMESIIGSTEWAHCDHAFPNLESLILQNLINMERICSGPLPAQAFTKLQVIKVKGCDRLEFVFSNSMVKHLSQLLEIEVSECKFVAKIIAEQRQKDDGETDKIKFPKMRSLTLERLPLLLSLYTEARVTGAENNDGFSSQLLNDKVEFPNLETLKLYSINVRKIWDDQLSAHSCFQNLTTLTVEGCEKLTYLFSYSVAVRLVKLQHLSISSCKLVKKIFVLDEHMGHFHLPHLRDLPDLPHLPKLPSAEEVPIFPNLETFVISHMDNLKSIWPDHLTQNSFCKLRKMEITSCNNLLNVLPYHVLDKLRSLESLDVWYCNAMEVVYEIEELNMRDELAIQLRTLSLGHLPNLKHLWSKDPQGSIRFENLFMVKATECGSLKHVFPLSVAKDLIQLQVLEISNCGVEEIVAKDEGEAEAAIGLVFPKLASLKFLNLPELRSFCTGNYHFRFPLLSNIYVVGCPAMESFSTGVLRASILRKIYLTLKGDQWHWEGDLNTTIRKIFNGEISKEN